MKYDQIYKVYRLEGPIDRVYTVGVQSLMVRAVQYVMVLGWPYRNDFTIWEECKCGIRQESNF